MINKPFEKLFKNYNFVAKLNIDLRLRPSDLSIDQYYKLTEYYEKLILILITWMFFYNF